jgi:hypothetical protein
MRKEEEGFRLGPSVPESGTAHETGSTFVFATSPRVIKHKQDWKGFIQIRIQWKCSAAHTARYGTLLVRGKQPKPSADGEKTCHCCQPGTEADDDEVMDDRGQKNSHDSGNVTVFMLAWLDYKVHFVHLTSVRGGP